MLMRDSTTHRNELYHQRQPPPLHQTRFIKKISITRLVQVLVCHQSKPELGGYFESPEQGLLCRVHGIPLPCLLHMPSLSARISYDVY